MVGGAGVDHERVPDPKVVGSHFFMRPRAQCTLPARKPVGRNCRKWRRINYLTQAP